jgi:hypothetical protein
MALVRILVGGDGLRPSRRRPAGYGGGLGLTGKCRKTRPSPANITHEKASLSVFNVGSGSPPLTQETFCRLTPTRPNAGRIP